MISSFRMSWKYSNRIVSFFALLLVLEYSKTYFTKLGLWKSWTNFQGHFFSFLSQLLFLFLTEVATIMPTTITTCTITTSTLTSPSSSPTTTYWNSKGCFGIYFCWTIATWFERLISVVLRRWGRRTLKWKKNKRVCVWFFFSPLCLS